MTNHTVHTIPENTTERFDVDTDGQTFENVIFDITNDGAACRLVVNAENATIRNVAWRGTQDTESYAVFALGGTSLDGTLIENIYMGDGSSTGESAGSQDPTAMWASANATGNVTIRGVNVQGWGDNGMYLSSADGLTPTIEYCYASDNNNAEYRVGSAGATIRHSVVENGQDRGVWAWGPDTATVENCDIHMQSGASAFWAGEANNTGATIDVTDTEYQGDISEPYGTVNFISGNGNSPDTTIPSQCPTSPDDAVTEDDSTNPNMIDINEGEDIAPHLDGTHTNETVEIPPGTYSRNSAVDVTLDNATIECTEGQATIDSGDQHNLGIEWVASGDSAIRNITFAGERGAGGPGEQQAVEVNSGGTLTFENVRWPDGAIQGTAHAMYVRSAHAGDVEFTGCYFAGFPDNAIYGSAPGASGGAIHVTDSEFYHNNVAAVRVGGDGSYVEDSYFEVDESQVTPLAGGAVTARGVWIHSDGQNYRVENNDFVFNTSGGGAIQDHPDGSGATTEVLNNRIQQDGGGQAIDLGRGNATGSGNHLTGSGNLDSSHESIVACRGSGCDVPENTTDDEWIGHEFSLITETEGDLDYTLTVTEGVRRVTDHTYPAEESNDDITDNGDGTFTVDGFTANAGKGDTYDIRGEVSDVIINTPETERAEFRLERAGSDVTTEYFPPDSQEVAVTFTQNGIQEVVIDGNVEWEADSE